MSNLSYLKKLLFLLFLLFTVYSSHAQHKLTKLWQTTDELATPESVLPANGILYVSLIDGDAWAKDGTGGVCKLTPEGKLLNNNWITGLNAPKGLAIKGNWLYVADVDELVVIDIKAGKIDHKIAIDGAKGLNDVTVDKAGIMYVTDSMTGRVHRVAGNTASVYMEGLEGINGIKAVDDKLYLLTGNGAYIAGADKKATKLCVLEHGGDGIEPVGNGDLLVTSWSGYLYYVHADGIKDLLLDTHTTNDKTADIGYDAKNKILYVPTFLGKSVVAYKLN